MLISQRFDKNTLISKTSLQLANYNDIVFSNRIRQLNYIEINKPALFETPLLDKDQIKRIVLFSDTPLEEPIYKSQHLNLKIW